MPEPLAVRRARINGGPGLAGYASGVPMGVLTLEVTDGLIRAVRIVVNPDKLRHIPPLKEGVPGSDHQDRQIP